MLGLAKNQPGTKTMRHQKSGRKFNRTSAHRDAMFTNMAASLFKHGLIKTTLPKAQELRRVAQPLLTMSKTDGGPNRRLACSRLRDQETSEAPRGGQAGDSQGRTR